MTNVTPEVTTTQPVTKTLRQQQKSATETPENPGDAHNSTTASRDPKRKNASTVFNQQTSKRPNNTAEPVITIMQKEPIQQQKPPPKAQSKVSQIQKNKRTAQELEDKIKGVKSARDLDLKDLTKTDASVNKLKEELDLIKSQERIRKLELEYNQCMMNHKSVVVQLTEKRSRIRSLYEQVKTARDSIEKLKGESVSTKKPIPELTSGMSTPEIEFSDHDEPVQGYTGGGESQAMV